MKKHTALKYYRKRKGYTLTSLSKKIGVSRQYLGYVENGEKILSYSLAYRISHVLDMKPDELFLDDYKKK